MCVFCVVCFYCVSFSFPALSQEIGQEELVQNDLFCVNQPDMTVIGFGLQHAMLRWSGGAMGKAFRLAISRSQVQILL